MLNFSTAKSRIKSLLCENFDTCDYRLRQNITWNWQQAKCLLFCILSCDSYAYCKYEACSFNKQWLFVIWTKTNMKSNQFFEYQWYPLKVISKKNEQQHKGTDIKSVLKDNTPWNPNIRYKKSRSFLSYTVLLSHNQSHLFECLFKKEKKGKF